MRTSATHVLMIGLFALANSACSKNEETPPPQHPSYGQPQQQPTFVQSFQPIEVNHQSNSQQPMEQQQQL